MLRRALIINPIDNVAMVLEDAKKGDIVEVSGYGTIELLEDVEFAHKVLLTRLYKGDAVIKYGEQIGYMLISAEPGTWIHDHNMGCDRGKI